MKHLRNRAVGLALLVATLISFGYISAQQKATQQLGRTQSTASQTPQQNDQLRDQVAQLQKQVQDMQYAIDDLRAQQQAIGVSVKETRELVLTTQIEQKQSREQRESVVRAVGQHDRQLDELGRQISGMMRDLGRVKTKVGLF